MSLLDLFDSSDDSAQNYLKQALQQYQNVQAPSIDSGTVSNLPQETVQGTVTPQQIASVDQAGSAYNNISLDPTSRQAMMNALSGYQDIADAGGLDANAKLGIQQAIDAANNQSRGAQGAIMQNAQAMGQGGGDFALTQRAIAAQGASNTAATQGLQQAAEAEANREAALAGLANIGGQINSSDYGQAAQKAAAQNSINSANQSYQNAANTGNVANNLASQQFNVGNAQTVNANNTAAKQSNAYYNASLPQQQFNNELQKAQGVAGIYGNQATAAQNASNASSAMNGKLLGTAGTIIGGMYGGPAGAAIGGSLGSSLSGSNAVASGAGSTPTGVNAQKSQYGISSYADGGAVPCYSAGGLAHDHSICMKMAEPTAQRYDLSQGAMVGGTPEVPGNSVKNDKVPAWLSPNELVIPADVPKTGPAMEAFAKQAPVAGDTQKRVDLTSFMQGYKKGR